jgi:hypothetical protein
MDDLVVCMRNRGRMTRNGDDGDTSLVNGNMRVVLQTSHPRID